MIHPTLHEIGAETTKLRNRGGPAAEWIAVHRAADHCNAATAQLRSHRSIVVQADDKGREATVVQGTRERDQARLSTAYAEPGRHEGDPERRCQRLY